MVTWLAPGKIAPAMRLPMDELQAQGVHQPQRIVLVIGTLRTGGAERQLSEMANYWAARQVQVTLATWCGTDVEDFYELSPLVERVRLASYRAGDGIFVRVLRSVRGVLRLRRMLQRLRPHVVLSFVDISNVHTILASLGLGMRVVVTERTNPAVNFTISRPWRWLRKKLYARASRVVAQTGDAARWIERECWASVQVIPNALRRLPQIDSARAPLIIAVGRLSREKGFDLLLRAFAAIAPRFPEWRVSIIGEGAYRSELVAMAATLRLTDRVEFVGQVMDPEAWMARAGLLVHPSRREGFPNVVLEAMAMGCPVVCSDCRSGPADLISDGVNGRLVPVDDLDALVAAMSDLMSSASQRERLGAEAAKIKDRYQQSVVMSRWDECLFPGQRCRV